MIADGLFQRFPCDAVFGVHNHPGMEPWRVPVPTCAFMAAGDKVTITIEGVGGHAARPHLTVDPVVVASSVVMALQTIVARDVDPSQPAVVTVGSLHAGTANNVIANSATMELSVRLVQRGSARAAQAPDHRTRAGAGGELWRDGDREVRGRGIRSS